MSLFFFLLDEEGKGARVGERQPDWAFTTTRTRFAVTPTLFKDKQATNWTGPRLYSQTECLAFVQLYLQ